MAAFEMPDEWYPVRIVALTPDGNGLAWHGTIEDANELLAMPHMPPGEVGSVFCLYADGTWSDASRPGGDDG